MGLFTSGKKGVDFKGWNNVPEPRFAYKEGNESAYLFFIDDHEDKDEILKQRLYAVDTSKKMIRVMIEKEVYDLTPEYYSKEALFAQLHFYNKINAKVLKGLFIGALAICIIGIVIVPLLIPSLSPMTSSMISLGLALIYMFYYMNIKFNKTLTVARKEYRDELIALIGKERLDEILDVQDAYIARRKKELSEDRQDAVLADDVPKDDVDEANKAKEDLESETKDEDADKER